jgi:hypothetical protein
MKVRRVSMDAMVNKVSKVLMDPLDLQEMKVFKGLLV